MSFANNIGVGNNINLDYIKRYNEELKLKKTKLFEQLREIEYSYQKLCELIIDKKLLENNEEKINIFEKTEGKINIFFKNFYMNFGTFEDHLINLEKKNSNKNNNNFFDNSIINILHTLLQIILFLNKSKLKIYNYLVIITNIIKINDFEIIEKIPELIKYDKLVEFRQNNSFKDLKGIKISPKLKFKSLFLLEKNNIIEFETFFSKKINIFFNFIKFLIKFYNSGNNINNREKYKTFHEYILPKKIDRAKTLKSQHGPSINRRATKRWENGLEIPINPFFRKKPSNEKKPSNKKILRFNPQNNIREFNFSKKLNTLAT